MIPIPRRITWEAHRGLLVVRCEEWEEHVEHVDHIELPGMPDGLTELSYWGLPEPRGYYRIAAGPKEDMTQEQHEIVQSWLLAARRMARNFFGVGE